MREKYEQQMKKGVLDMLVLKLLEPEPKYGYQIIQEMKEKSADIFSLKDGTLYPVLYRLEDDGLVKSEWSAAQGKQVSRKYYQITDAGKDAMFEKSALQQCKENGNKKAASGRYKRKDCAGGNTGGCAFPDGNGTGGCGQLS